MAAPIGVKEEDLRAITEARELMEGSVIRDFGSRDGRPEPLVGGRRRRGGGREMDLLVGRADKDGKALAFVYARVMRVDVLKQRFGVRGMHIYVVLCMHQHDVGSD